MRNYITIILLAVSLISCKNNLTTDSNRVPVVSWKDKVLYQDQLANHVPVTVSKKDSASYASAYIDKWLREEMFHDKAIRNTTETKDIDELVEKYKRDIINYKYQQKLLAEKVRGDVREDSLRTYYETMQGKYSLDVPLVKGVFMKIPIGEKGIAEMRRYYRDTTEVAIDNIEKYSMRHCTKYEFFYNNWKPINEVASWLPISTDELTNRVKNQSRVDIKDTAYVYLLNVSHFLDKGDKQPFEYAKEGIRNTLIELNRKDFIENMKNDLLEKADKKGEIKYYHKNK